MKKYISLTLQSFCLILGLVLMSACKGESTIANDGSAEEDKEYFYLTFLSDSLFDHKEVRATVLGTTRETQVQALTVMLFDRTTGEKKVIPGFSNPYTFNVASPVNTEWMNDDPTTKTVKLLVTREQAKNLVVYAFANLTTGMQNAIGSKTNVSQLADVVADFSMIALNPNRSNLAQQMVGRIETTTDSVKDYRVFVPLVRTTAKVSLVLHFGYDEMVKDQPFTYRYMRFKSKHYFIGNDGIQDRYDSTANSTVKTPTQFDRPQDTVTLGPFFINDYDISATPDVPAPYVLFDFLARRPIAKFDQIPIGWLPPPSGGEYNDEGYVERRHYYRLVMPRVIKRNTHYVIHAYFLGEGGYTPDGTNVASMSFSVLDWVLGTTAPIKEY